MSLHGELKRSSACCRPAGCIVSKNSNVGFAQELLLSSLIFTSWQNSAGPVLSYADILIWGYLQQLFLSSCVIVSLQFWSLQLCFNTMSKIIPGLDVPPNSSHLSLWLHDWFFWNTWLIPFILPSANSTHVRARTHVSEEKVLFRDFRSIVKVTIDLVLDCFCKILSF